jgi:hypothetical protein
VVVFSESSDVDSEGDTGAGKDDDFVPSCWEELIDCEG